MGEFSDREELGECLKGEVREAAIILAARTALRVTPMPIRKVGIDDANIIFILQAYRSTASAIAYGFEAAEIACASAEASTNDEAVWKIISSEATLLG